VTLKLLLTTLSLYRRITSRLRKCEFYLLPKQLKALYLINRLLRTLYTIEDNKCLSLCFKIRLCNDIDYGTIFLEELTERLLQLLDFDPFFEVARVDPRSVLASAKYVSECNDTYVALGGGFAAILRMCE
jgi:hypothetical protein